MTGTDATADITGEASEAFVRRLHADWNSEDQRAFEARMASDPAYAEAYRRAERSWSSLDAHAESAEILAYREEALVLARRERARHWLKSSRFARRRWGIAAAIGGVALAAALAWQVSPYGFRPGEYRTGIGEQRMVELDDHSRIAVDAVTRLQVRYSKDARTVVLKQGQAQFSVAQDPTRPFKVLAGNHTIVALGTVFTVEYVDQRVHVAMMEGRVAVVPQSASPPAAAQPVSDDEVPTRGAVKVADASNPRRASSTIELSTGEELRVNSNGPAVVTAKADLEAATAWREGKVIFRSEPVEEAVRRLSRYSRVQIEIEDQALAGRRISGVFDAGDTQGFVSAIQRYMPVTAEQSESGVIKLRMR